MFGCIMRLITRLYECLLVVVAVFRNNKLQVGGAAGNGQLVVVTPLFVVIKCFFEQKQIEE
jgi:hypothetical protein